MTVGKHIREWLDEIGADGLMVKDGPVWTKEQIDEANGSCCWSVLVPAFRHADGSYHTEKESPCADCNLCSNGFMTGDGCSPYQSWLAHKEATK